MTGSSHHYAPYNILHVSNTHDVLWGAYLVPELQDAVKSKAVKLLFADMRKNYYFLNSMAPSTHVLLMRCEMCSWETGTTSRKPVSVEFNILWYLMLLDCLLSCWETSKWRCGAHFTACDHCKNTESTKLKCKINLFCYNHWHWCGGTGGN